MAEQYSPFQVDRPNIDVNLYARNDSAGIAAGNAQKTKTQSIISGIQEGVKFAADLNQELAQTEAQQIKNDIYSDPAVKKAMQEQEIQQVELNRQKIALGLLNNQDKLDMEKLEIQARKEEATTKINDNKATELLADTINKRGQLPQEVVDQRLSDPTVASLMLRKPDVALQTADGLEGYADPFRLASIRDRGTATKRSNEELDLQSKIIEGTITDAEKNKEKFDKSVGTLSLDPTLKTLITGGRIKDPTKLQIVKDSEIERDLQGKIVFNSNGTPKAPSKEKATPSKNYTAILDGEEVATYGEETGKRYAEALPDYQTTAGTILKTPPTPKMEAGTASADYGLAGDRTLDNIAKGASPATTPRPAPTLPPAALEGKTPAQQTAMQERFTARLDKLQNIPREYRPIINAVNSNQYLQGAAPIFKSIASKESAGKHSAVSDTGVKGIMQVTQATYEGLMKVHPEAADTLASLKGTELGSVIAGKLVFIDELVRFKNDVPLALAAYNGGGPLIEEAVRRTKGTVKTWESVRESLRGMISEKPIPGQITLTQAKFDEIYNYPQEVLKFFKYYNG